MQMGSDMQMRLRSIYRMCREAVQLGEKHVVTIAKKVEFLRLEPGQKGPETQTGPGEMKIKKYISYWINTRE